MGPDTVMFECLDPLGLLRRQPRSLHVIEAWRDSTNLQAVSAEWALLSCLILSAAGRLCIPIPARLRSHSLGVANFSDPGRWPKSSRAAGQAVHGVFQKRKLWSAGPEDTPQRGTHWNQEATVPLNETYGISVLPWPATRMKSCLLSDRWCEAWHE